MNTSDLHNNCKAARALSPAAAAITDNTAQVSQIIDRAGFGGVEFFIATGTLADADATFTVLVEDGEDSGLTDNAGVADAYLIGTEALASFTFSDDNVVKKIGYFGKKRYVRLTITPANNTGNAPLCVIAVKVNPRIGPQT